MPPHSHGAARSHARRAQDDWAALAAGDAAAAAAQLQQLGAAEAGRGGQWALLPALAPFVTELAPREVRPGVRCSSRAD
jgi:hypothetical protein